MISRKIFCRSGRRCVYGGAGGVLVQVCDYLSAGQVSRRESALTWWRHNARRYPDLAPLARRYLATPPGSQTRSSCLPECAEQRLFIKHNLAFLKH